MSLSRLIFWDSDSHLVILKISFLLLFPNTRYLFHLHVTFKKKKKCLLSTVYSLKGWIVLKFSVFCDWNVTFILLEFAVEETVVAICSLFLYFSCSRKSAVQRLPKNLQVSNPYVSLGYRNPHCIHRSSFCRLSIRWFVGWLLICYW